MAASIEEGHALSAFGEPLQMRRTVLSSSPLIVHVEGFLSPRECEHVRSLASLEHSYVVGADGSSVLNEARSSSGGFVYRKDTVTVALERRIELLTGIDASHGEPFYVLSYERGQQYRPHPDYFSGLAQSESKRRKVLMGGGQRVATVLMYASDVLRGGATQFPMVNITVHAKYGDALYWRNVREQQQIGSATAAAAAAGNSLGGLVPDHRSIHAGMMVEEGRKWAITKWIRQRPRSLRTALYGVFGRLS